MKLLIVIPSLTRGGAERAASRLTHEWAKRHDVTVCVFDTSRTAFPVAGKLIDLRASPRGNLLVRLGVALLRVQRLITVIWSEQPDKIIAFMETANFPAALAASFLGRLNTVTVSVHNNPSSFARGHRVLMAIIYRFVQRIVPVSEGIAGALVKMGIPRSRIQVIPNPIDISGFQASDEAAWRARQPYILGIGRLTRQKGFERLIDAFAMLKHEKLQLVILGEGPERQVLERHIYRLGLQDRVFLLGAIADPFPAYRNAECFVLSSRHEGWPNVILEAMISRCPVASFDCEFGPSEIIENGTSGLLVSADSVVGLAGAVEAILDDQLLRRRLAENGYDRARYFDVTNIAPLWLT